MSNSSKPETKTNPKTETKKQEAKKETSKTEATTSKAEGPKTKPALETKATPKIQDAKTTPKATSRVVTSQDSSQDTQVSVSQKKTEIEVSTNASANQKPSALNTTDHVKSESQTKIQQPSIPVPAVKDAADSPAPPPKIIKYRKPNYVKYDKNKKVLVDLLRTGTHSTGFIGHKANVASNSTIFKYQSLAANETGLLLISKEELDYMRTNSPADMMAKIEDRLMEQNKGWKDRYEEAEREFEAQSTKHFSESQEVLP